MCYHEAMEKKSLFTEIGIIVFGVLVLAAGVWYYHAEQPKGGGPAFFKETTSTQGFFSDAGPLPASAPAASSSVANPASVFCADHGGTLTIQTAPNGGQYGICRLSNGNECEEWAMFRGDCPAGGVNVSGYNTPAATYCVLRGGVYQVTQTAPNVPITEEQGTCGFKNGGVCDVWGFYRGMCDPNAEGTLLDCPAWVNCMPGPPDASSTLCVVPPGCEHYTQKAF